MPIWTDPGRVLSRRAHHGLEVIAIALGLVGVIVIVRSCHRRDQSGPADRTRRGVGFWRLVAMMKSLTRTEKTGGDYFLDAGDPVRGGFAAGALCLEMAIRDGVGLGRRDRFCGTFSHYCMARAMLYADATVVLPMDFSRSADRHCGWLLLFGAAGPVYRARRGADPRRQSAEFETQELEIQDADSEPVGT